MLQRQAASGGCSRRGDGAAAAAGRERRRLQWVATARVTGRMLALGRHGVYRVLGLASCRRTESACVVSKEGRGSFLFVIIKAGAWRNAVPRYLVHKLCILTVSALKKLRFARGERLRFWFQHTQGPLALCRLSRSRSRARAQSPENGDE